MGTRLSGLRGLPEAGLRGHITPRAVPVPRAKILKALVDAKAADENRSSYAEMLRQQEARNLRAVLLQRLRKESSIDLNAKLLEQQARSSQAGS